jgi:hypothetical protein
MLMVGAVLDIAMAALSTEPRTLGNCLGLVSLVPGVVSDPIRVLLGVVV